MPSLEWAFSSEDAIAGKAVAAVRGHWAGIGHRIALMRTITFGLPVPPKTSSGRVVAGISYPTVVTVPPG